MNIFAWICGFRNCHTCKKAFHKTHLLCQDGCGEYPNWWFCAECGIPVYLKSSPPYIASTQPVCPYCRR